MNSGFVSGVAGWWQVFTAEELPYGGNSFEFVSGAACVLAMADDSQLTSFTMQSACMIVGVGNVWCLNLKVLVMRSPPVSAMIVFMHQ